MCPNRRHVYKSTIVFKFVVESRLEEACRARPRQTDATDGSNLHPLGTNLHRSFAPSHCFVRGLAGYCGLLHGKAPASSECRLPIGAAFQTFQGGLQAASGPAPKVESSRRTRRRHIRTRSCTARWSCFPTAILCPHPAAGTPALLDRPPWPNLLTHTCVSR